MQSSGPAPGSKPPAAWAAREGAIAIGGHIGEARIRSHWDEILRLAISIKQGTVTASLMLRKLGSYPRKNGLALALRELGHIERTLLIMDWLGSVDLRRCVNAGLNKGESRTSMAIIDPTSNIQTEVNEHGPALVGFFVACFL